MGDEPRPPKEFVGERIAVTFDASICISAAECRRGLPAVFPDGPGRTQPDAAEPDEIARVILKCPSGALKFTRLDGGPQEQPEPYSLSVQKGGPYYVRGDVTITDHRGNVIRKDTRIALCRCGQSSNKPFCDGTHNKITFE